MSSLSPSLARLLAHTREEEITRETFRPERLHGEELRRHRRGRVRRWSR